MSDLLKRITFIPVLLSLLCLALAVQAQPYLTARSYGGTVYQIVLPGVTVHDTLKGLTPLVLTFEAAYDGTNGYSFAVVPDSINATKTPSTDSLACSYRGIPHLREINTPAGSARYPLVWRTANGDTARILNWTPGAMHFVSELVLDKGPYHQFTLTGSAGDTIPIRAYFVQGEP